MPFKVVSASGGLTKSQIERLFKIVQNFVAPGGTIQLQPGMLLTWIVLESLVDQNVSIGTTPGGTEIFDGFLTAGEDYEINTGWRITAPTTLYFTCAANLTAILYKN